MKKNILTWIAVIMCVFMLAGCGQKGESTGASEGEQETSEEQLLVIDGKPAKVVYISNENASAWQTIGTGYLKTLVESVGGTCQILNPDGDSQKQAQMAEDAFVLQPDVLVIKPIDAVGIVPVLKKFNEAGIPIIALDTGVEGDVGLLTHIQTDQYSLGSINAEYVIKVAEETGVKANVVSVLGDITSTIAQDRQNGFNETADKSDLVEVLSETEAKWDPNKAYDAVKDMFQRFPEANTVYIQADCMQSGVIQALKELDRLAPMGDPDHVTIVSVDADPSGVKFIQEGYTDQCTEHNAALHSDIAFKVIVDYLHGYDIPQTLYFETTAVNKDNVDSSDRWGTMDTSKVSEWTSMDQDKYVMQTAAQ